MFHALTSSLVHVCLRKKHLSEGKVFQCFRACTVHTTVGLFQQIFTHFMVFWCPDSGQGTCDRMAPLTPLCCIILTHTANTGLTHCRALVIICKVQPSLSAVRTHSRTHTQIRSQYTANTRKTAAKPHHQSQVMTNNASVSLTTWPYRYCRCLLLSQWCQLLVKKVWFFTAPISLHLCLYQVLWSFYSLWIHLQIYPF